MFSSPSETGGYFFFDFFCLKCCVYTFLLYLSTIKQANNRVMTQQDYINQIIKNNLTMGFSLKEIMADIKSAMQRSLKYELQTLDAVQELCETEQGYAQMKRLTNA